MSKRDNNGLLWVGAIAALGWWWYRNHPALGAQLRNLRYSIATFDVRGDNVEIGLRIDNPNSEDIEVKSAVGDILANGNHIGTVTSYYHGDGLMIRANEYSIMHVSVKTNTLDIIGYLAQLLTHPSRQLYVFRGIININDTPIPVTAQLARN